MPLPGQAMSPKLCHLYARTDALFDRHCYFESMDRDSERVTYLSDEVGILRERICNVMAQGIITKEYQKRSKN